MQKTPKLCINLIKYRQDLYPKNYNTLMKEIKDLSEKECHIHGLGVHIVKIDINYPLTTLYIQYNSSQSPVK